MDWGWIKEEGVQKKTVRGGKKAHERKIHSKDWTANIISAVFVQPKYLNKYGLLFDIYCSTEAKPQLLCVRLLCNTTIKLKFVVECNVRLKFSTYSFVPLRKNGINFAEPSFSAITRPKYTYTTEEMPISFSATLSYASMVMLN